MSPRRSRSSMRRCSRRVPDGGRGHYESFAGAWLERSATDRINTMLKHVVSTTLRNPAWRTPRSSADRRGPRAQRRPTAVPSQLGSGRRPRAPSITWLTSTADDLPGHRRSPPVLRRLVETAHARRHLTFSSGVILLTYRPALRPPALLGAPFAQLVGGVLRDRDPPVRLLELGLGAHDPADPVGAQRQSEVPDATWSATD